MPSKDFEKDDATGVVSVNCGDSASFTVAGIPGVVARNADGRIFIPSNGEPYQVVVRTKGKDFVVAEGVSNTRTAGKATPIWIRVRAEPEAIPPKAPVATPEVIV